MQLAVVTEDVLLHTLDTHILLGQELHQVQDPGLVLCLIVVTVLNLTLEGSELYGLLTSAWVGAIDDGIMRLKLERRIQTLYTGIKRYTQVQRFILFTPLQIEAPAEQLKSRRQPQQLPYLQHTYVKHCTVCCNSHYINTHTEQRSRNHI